MSTPRDFILTAVHALPAVADEWWTVLCEGNLQHEFYGEMKFTPQRLQRFHENIQKRTLGQDIPLDVNHMSSTEGAPGWIIDSRVTTLTEGPLAGKQVLQIKPELNDLGDKLITNKRVKYLSASFRDTWRDNFGKPVKDVMTAVAVTERPWVKNLPPIALTENAQNPGDTAGLMLFVEASDMPNQDHNEDRNDTPGGDTSLADMQAQMTQLRADNETLRTQLAGESLQRERVQLTATLRGTNFGTETNRYELSEAVAGEAADVLVLLSDEAPVDGDGKAVLLTDGKPAPSDRAKLLAVLTHIAGALVPQGVQGFSGVGGETVDLSDQAKAEAEVIKLAEKISDEKKLSFREALGVVRSEHADVWQAAGRE